MAEISSHRAIAHWSVPRLETIHTAVPYVIRNIGRQWSTSSLWTFEGLAALNPQLSVKLVKGNRERESTSFVESTFGEYLGSLQKSVPSSEDTLYLKEFDLLKIFPQLHKNLPYKSLFPTNTIKSNSAWIGPAGAKTGLHYDYLDNFAWLVAGKKRFYLSAPGSMERIKKLSRKYDRWAQLASTDIHEPSLLASNHDLSIHAVDLEAGDCLFVPKNWWHQVENLEASILLSGFFGPRAEVLTKWVWTGLRQIAHQVGFLGRKDCTCCAYKKYG